MMQSKYLHKQDFFNCKKQNTDSPVWKSLLNCRPLLKQGLMWQIGNGESISFWSDNWIENKNLIDIIHADEATIPRPHAKVSEFIQHDRTWNITALAATLGNHPILKAIHGIIIPAHTKPDTFCWGLNTSGNFSTKSAMWIAHDQSIHELPDWDFKWIWKTNTMPKIKIFL